MSKHTHDLMAEIFGDTPPKPWAERTEEEKRLGWEQFRAAVHAEDIDKEVDELFDFIRAHREVPFLRAADQEIDAA